MYETVLVPTDGSETMDDVARHARDVARRRDATVHVLYVIDDRAFLTMDDDRVGDVVEQLSEEGEASVQDLEASFEADGLDVTTGLRQGDPASEITAATDDVNADLVVMGTHGSDPGDNLLGSTAQRVVTKSAVPVTVVPVSGEDETGGKLDSAATVRD